MRQLHEWSSLDNNLWFISSCSTRCMVRLIGTTATVIGYYKVTWVTSSVLKNVIITITNYRKFVRYIHVI